MREILTETFDSGSNLVFVESRVILKLFNHSLEVDIQGIRVFVVLSQAIVQGSKEIKQVISGGIEIKACHSGAVAEMLIQNRVCLAEVQTALAE